MATGKKSFLAYADWKSVFDELPNEDAGKLIKHIFAYVNDENPKSDSVLINAVFANIKSTLKRDLDKWENQLEQRRTAGKKSAEIRRTKSNERSTVVHETERNSTVSVSVNVNDNNTILPTSTKSAIDFDFEKFLIFFNKTLGKNHKKINDTVKAKIKARLKEGYTKHDFQKAVENIAKEKYHIETQFKHATPEFISRADKLEMYIGKSDVNNERVYVEPRICDY
jgi:uncharacterized phage protein (TIGR02220 family)